MSGPCWAQLPRPGTCLNGGYCTGNQSACVCPPGYSSDNIIFHNQNCALPDSALVGFVVYYSIASFIVGVMVIRECRYTINLAKRLGSLTVALLVVGWLMVVVSVTEGGYFEAVAFLVFVAESICASLGYHLFLAFVIPMCTLYRVPHNRIRLLMKRWSILLSGPFFAFFVMLAKYSRNQDETFNWVQSAHFLFILVGNTVFVSALIYHSWNLSKILDSLSRSNMPSHRLKEVQFLERRTKMMAFALCLFLVLVVVTVTTIVAMVLTLGSAPFAWVFAMVVAHFSIVLGIGMTVFLWRGRDSEDRSSLGVVVVRNQEASDMPGYDYMSWTKTNTTNTKHLTSPNMTPRINRPANESGAVKAVLEDSMAPITEITDDGSSNGTGQNAQNESPQTDSTTMSESDRVVRRGRGVVVQSSHVSTDVEGFVNSLSLLRTRTHAVSGPSFSTLSSKRGDIGSSVLQSGFENVTDPRNRSLPRTGRKRGIFASKSTLASRVDEEPDF